MTEQLDMFAAPPAPLPATPPVVEEPPAPAPTSLHWLHITTKRAMTACDISVPAFYRQLGVGYDASGEKIACTINRDDGTVMCQRCLQEMS
ncbi:hypothetical protein [Bradyrhizobium sp.]|uniref:hypothetical protein n=1 Tax=Bradyrhizobium sp. TaxID=376 RepID=UPI0039E57BF8